MTMEKLPPHRVQAPYPILKAVFPHAAPAIHNWWASAYTFIIQVLTNSSTKKYSTEISGFFPPEKTDFILYWVYVKVGITGRYHWPVTDLTQSS